MTASLIRGRIDKALTELDEGQLESVYLIIKELAYQQKNEGVSFDNALLDAKIKTGVAQLAKGEGINFREFLNEAQASYGKKKG